MPIMGDAGEVTNYLKIIQDVTREKFIGRIKSEFINIAAHQLRTPLSAIKWALRLLLDGDAGELRARQRDILEQGYRTNERMIRLVNDLLNVSRIEEGRFGYQFAKHDLRAFLLEVLEGSRMELEKKQLRLHIDIPQTLGLFTFDPEKLRLALTNVLENAVNYTPADGEVSLAAREQAQFVEITIADTGIGIPEEDRARLFTKFFRGSNVVRMQTEGSGLGLFLVKNIMLNHGGSVHIASAEEKGTVVTLLLPRSEAAIPQEEQTFEEFVTGL